MSRDKSKYITVLLNSTVDSIKYVIPHQYKISKPRLEKKRLLLQHGVLIGVTGDIRGQLIFAGETTVFSAIGETMFGMPLEGEMLSSFSGELGNMLAGNMSSNLVDQGFNMDITPPSILEGGSIVAEVSQPIHLSVFLEAVGKMDIYLLVE
jgi:chemotaxis protein CheX